MENKTSINNENRVYVKPVGELEQNLINILLQQYTDKYYA